MLGQSTIKLGWKEARRRYEAISCDSGHSRRFECPGPLPPSSSTAVIKTKTATWSRTSRLTDRQWLDPSTLIFAYTSAMPVTTLSKEIVWRRRTGLEQWAMWAGWLELTVLFAFCWQMMVRNVMWVFVEDAPRARPPTYSHAPGRRSSPISTSCGSRSGTLSTSRRSALCLASGLPCQ
jgi:hypothetical protein